MDPWAIVKSTSIFVLLVHKVFSLWRFVRKELKLVEWNHDEICGMFWQVSPDWTKPALYARVRKPFRCCDWLSEFFKRVFLWRKLWTNLSMYIIRHAFHFSHHSHALVTLHVQFLCNLTGEFMRKIYATSCNLFTLTAEADRVLWQLVMFRTVFFHWMYKMKCSCYQESSVIHGWFVYWIFG